MRTTVNFTYYDAPTKLATIVHMYNGKVPEDVTITIIDDGSPKYPVTSDMVPADWRIYRITEDIGWNSEGAKNLAMHVSEDEWNVTCDLDHPVVADHLVRLNTVTDILPPDAAYNPVRISGSKCINSYLATKELWWKVGGYDENFSGHYGYDLTLKKAFTANDIKVLRLDAINLDSIGGEIPISRDAKARSREGFYSKYGMQQLGKWPRDEERLRFPWQRLQ